ncbi:hypothetical protein [Flavobacterium silvaticum]|uniref:DUF4890 domain-containing protein n=1 Tax=Flavobacterium silvaticum TaxID=1852020 RepID=A0A972FR19_9FLAO|nr:hypothetical protein [Flavobacterium silvaticum]NMH27799.1 hypothetical protein [Flavobacterium silvaticum]
MKRIKNLLLLTFVLTSSLTFAQQNTSAAASALTQKMKAYIGFNEALTPKVQEINEAFITKAAAVKNSPEARKEKMSDVKEADKERTAALKAIFSDEEFRKFQEFKKENRQELKKTVSKRKTEVPE